MSVQGNIRLKMILEKFYKLKFLKNYFENQTLTFSLCTGNIVMRNAYTNS